MDFSNIPKHRLIFFIILLFFGFLWILNPGKYTVTASFILLIGVFHYFLKNFSLSTFLVFVISLIVNSGKSYIFPLIPPGVFPIVDYPDGYYLTATITPTVIISIVLAVVTAKNFFLKKTRDHHGSLALVFFLLFFLWTIMSNLFGSSEPILSSLYSVLSLPLLIGVLFIESYPNDKKVLFRMVIHCLAALVCVEFFIGIHQFINHAPLAKTLEVQQHIVAFGEGTDELQFRFRPTGTFSHANSLASFFSFVLPVLFFSSLVCRSKLLFLSFASGVIMLILTLSRSGWIGFSLGMLINFYFMKKNNLQLPINLDTIKKWKLPIGIISGVLVLFFLWPRLQASINITSDEKSGGLSIRLLQIQNALELISLRPFFGVGTGMSVPEGLAIDPLGIISFFPSPVHNIFLLMAVEHGLPALAFFVLLMLFFIRIGLTKKAGLVGGIASALIVGMFQPFLPTMFIALLFFTVL